MDTVASQITSLTIVYTTVYPDADQSKHQSSTSLAFVWGIHRGPVNSPHKGPVTRKMFPFDDVIMTDNWLTMNKTPYKHIARIHTFSVQKYNMYWIDPRRLPSLYPGLLRLPLNHQVIFFSKCDIIFMLLTVNVKFLLEICVVQRIFVSILGTYGLVLWHWYSVEYATMHFQLFMDWWTTWKLIQPISGFMSR